jgi:molybdenum cofactor cytidylyltransferase
VPGIGIVILAAGGSTRMGTPKQRLAVDGQSMLRRAAQVALDAGGDPVIVVLGHSASEMQLELQGQAVHVAMNDHWVSGMGTSIRSGMETLMAIAPASTGVILMLCDQPAVSAESIRRLMAMHDQSHKPICAAAYGDTIGSPALFAASLFSELMELADSEGGKTMIRRHPADIASVPLPEAEADIDTPADYLRLIRSPAS